MWNPKAELTKKAAELAKKKHPGGFNKNQLIEASEEVYGGFGATQVSQLATKKIRTMEDVNNMGNAMASIDGHYPVGMSGCEVVGISGQCGPECPVYLNGKCDEPHEMVERLESPEELDNHLEMYGSIDP